MRLRWNAKSCNIEAENAGSLKVKECQLSDAVLPFCSQYSQDDQEETIT